MPLKILKQRFGRAVLGEVIEAAVQEATQKTLDERGLRPAIQPRIDAKDFQEDKDFEYEMTVEVLPDIDPGDYKKYDLERLKVEPSDDDVSAAVDRLADQRRVPEPISRKMFSI